MEAKIEAKRHSVLNKTAKRRSIIMREKIIREKIKKYIATSVRSMII
ncbi:hypothetical protein [Bacillus sonorensis]|nr:hypothetical protein [Bacillus sonorensis]TWK83660.1 hypothetical protein CHCC20335_4731 [Bacillus paralicheniformis]